MQLDEEEHRDDVSDSSVATEDSYTYTWQATEFVRCPGSKYVDEPCAQGTLIKRGVTKCNRCKQAKADQREHGTPFWRLVRTIWQDCDGYNEPPPDSEDSDPEGNNVTFHVVGGNVMVAEGGDSFTRSQAVCAAMDVARALAANGECGFEELIEPGHETQAVTKNVDSAGGYYHSVMEQVVCRIAYVADPNVLAYNTVKAASMLGGVHVRPPVILGKHRMAKIGQINEGVHSRFLGDMLERIAHRRLKLPTTERDQIKALFDFDADDIAIFCNAALAAGCVAHIIKQMNDGKLDTEHLKWHMFHGGRSIMGEPPHLAVSMFMDCRTPHPIKKRCITRTLRARYNPHPCGY